MINPTEEKKMLIESMKKLVAHVSNNPQRQTEIFQALSQQDLNKIVVNLKDQNQYLRRISALLLCELFFMCKETKQKAVEQLSLFPREGRICLGGIPETIGKYPSTLKKCLQLMKSPPEEGEQDKMCWLINLERKTLRLQLLQYRKYSSFTFIDPNKNIFGFTLLKNRIPHLVQHIKQHQTNKQNQLLQMPRNKANQINSQFYKTFLEARDKTSQSKRHSIQGNYLNTNSNQTERQIRNTTRTGQPHLSVTLTPSTKREEILKTSTDGIKPNSNLTMSLGGKGYGIQRIINSVRNKQDLQKSVENSFLAYRRAKEQQKQIKQQSHSKQKQMNKFESTRKSTSSRQASNDPERFYRRVKEILHK